MKCKHVFKKLHQFRLHRKERTFGESRRVVIDVAEGDVDYRRSGQPSQLSAHVLGLDEDLVLFFDFPVHVGQSCSNNTLKEKKITKDKYCKCCIFQNKIACNKEMILPRFTSKDTTTNMVCLLKSPTPKIWLEHN